MMIKAIFIIIALQFANEMYGQNQFQKKDSSGYGRVYYYVSASGYNKSTTRFMILIDDNIVCKVKNSKRYSVHYVIPGEHRFSGQLGKQSNTKAKSIMITIEPEKVYYIQLRFHGHLFSADLFCEEVTENAAKSVLPKLMEDTNCQKWD